MSIIYVIVALLAIFIWVTEYQLEEKRSYERCHERHKKLCKDIVTDKKCNKCPYRIKTMSL